MANCGRQGLFVFSHVRIMPESGQRRIEVLDSLRGLAALAVVGEHCIGSVGNISARLADWLRYTPFRLFVMEGRAAVILFFVLSGFVLSLPFLSNRGPSYPRFAVKRVCRIYLPYIAAVLLSVALYEVPAPQPLSGLPAALDSLSSERPSFALFLSNAAMLGTVRSAILDPQSWTLVHELRISLTIPILVWCVRRSSFRSLAAALGLFWICHVIGKSLGLAYFACSSTFFDSFIVTGYFVLFFVIGVVGAKHAAEMTAFAARVPRYALVIVAAAVFWGLIAHSDLAKGVAAITLIAFSHRIGRILSYAPLLWLGRVSYSLYIVHISVQLAVMHLLYLRVPIAVAAIAGVPASLCVAALFYRFVEWPSLVLSRRLGLPPAASAGTSAQSTPAAP
jgi:peptidoglycan/LPS O-acetylase OafA/YrhL